MARYPIGQQDFREVIKEGCIYVDKTKYISMLLEEGKYFFLGRPRRFGKSLFLSTLEYFFLGERQLFKGLDIDSYGGWDWEPHPVIHLDLNGADYSKTEGSLEEVLGQRLAEIETRYGLEAFEGSVSTRFRSLILRLCEKTGRQVAVLVDEYEKPVVDNIAHPMLADYHKATLRGFYGVLKSLDRCLKMVFLTGVTKFGKMSVFSELNNIRDISFNPAFGAVCGVTEEELRRNFREGVEKLAEAQGTDRGGALALLKAHYDGYHFSEGCPDIYNPFSLISCLADGRVRAYWASTGTPNLLAELIVKKRYDIEELDNSTATEEQLSDIRQDFLDPISLFYQTGYLTIKSGRGGLYTLGFPNREVEGAFSTYLMPYYLRPDVRDPESIYRDFMFGITSGNPGKAIRAFEAFSAGINYDLAPEPEMERHFQSMVYMFSRMLLPYTVSVRTEEHTSDGRIDLLLATTEYVYIIEIKRDSTPGAALRQIEEKGYALQYREDPRKVFLIGLNFSTSKRRLDGYEIKE